MGLTGGDQERTSPPGCIASPSAKLCETEMAALLVMMGQISSLILSLVRSCPRMRGAETMHHAANCKKMASQKI